MNKLYFLLFFLIASILANAQYQWAWVGGDKTHNIKGTYGSQGVASSSNIPGSRSGAATWTDKNGNFWLFGGIGKDEAGQTGYLNDLWKFSPSSKLWTWVGGGRAINNNGKYGSKGMPSPLNQPGARQNAVAWTDQQGNFWLFAGLGMAATKEEQEAKRKEEEQNNGNPGNPGNGNGGNGGKHDDKDDDDKGKDKDDKDGKGKGHGKDDDKNHGDKDSDADHDKGKGHDDKDHGNDKGRDGDDNVVETAANAEEGLLNDLWMYAPETGQWTWISGHYSANQKGKYGDRAKAANEDIPGSRYMSTGWIDAANNLWIFGGKGYSSSSDISDMNDLWKYSTSSKVWTWMKGDRSGSGNGDYGQKGEFAKNNTPAGRKGSTTWVDKDGRFWLFGGGAGSHVLNDLWSYDPVSNQWAWISGSKNADKEPNFTEQGVPSKNADPGSRMLATGWPDKENNMWMFGGEGYGTPRSGTRPLNNLWKYSITNNEWTFVNGEALSEPQPTFGSQGRASEENNPGGTSNVTAWKGNDGSVWIFGGQSLEGYLNITWKLAACNGPVAGNIAPASATLCKGGSQTLTATGGSSYTWMRDGQTIDGQTAATIVVTEPGTYTAIISNGICSSAASNAVTITLNDTVTGMRYPDVTAKSNEPVQLAAREIGMSYEWIPAVGLDNPLSVTARATLSADQQYLVQITTEQGCIITDTVSVKIDNGNNNQHRLKVAIPTAFTPNGNNMNDLLRPLGQIASIDYFRVYNRWGQMMFQTSVIGEGWDGKFKGIVQSPDSYTWLFSGKTTDGQQVKLSGKTILIR